MDNTQLAIVVITAVIATLAKELAVWATKKTTSSVATLIRTLIRKVTPIRISNFRSFLVCTDVVLMASNAVMIIWSVYFSDQALSKVVVMNISLSSGAWFYWMHQLIRDAGWTPEFQEPNKASRANGP